MSDADNVKAKLPSSSIVWLSTELITGASLTGFTVNVKDWESSNCVSVTLTTTSMFP